MIKPSISAIAPVHNTEPSELEQALQSIKLAHLDDEILLIDDHSTSTATVRALRRASERGCRVIPSRGFRNQAAARATGVAAARGDFCLSFDSDDTIDRGPSFRRDQLAPIAIASSNAHPHPPLEIWDYLANPQPIQWGALVRRDIALSVTDEIRPARQEPLYWGARLLIKAWRHRTPVAMSGLRYHWREPGSRSCVTNNQPQHGDSRQRAINRQIEAAITREHLTDRDTDSLMLWHNRKQIQCPYIESRTKPGARVDIHVVSYSGSASWLKQTLASLEQQPCNVHLVVGGFPGNIGAARACGFRQGNAEYVGFADDDDILAPGIIKTLVDILDQRPDAVGVYTDTRHLHPDGHSDIERKGRPWNPLRQLTYAPEVTHAKIMRRSAIGPTLRELPRWPTFEEYVQCCLLCESGIWVHLPIAGATKRFRSTTVSSMRLASRRLWDKAVERVTPTMAAQMEAFNA